MQNTLSRSVVALAVVVIVATGCQGAGGTPAPGSREGDIKIGVDLPQSGNEVANGEPTFRGVELAVEEKNAEGGIGGKMIGINNQDDAVNGLHNPEQGATNAGVLVADTKVVGMVGPFNSNVARTVIPVTNEAGLAQCSPANTAVDLTKEGSEVYRSAKPDQYNYFRLAAPDDIQGPAMAAFDYNDLGARRAYILDDTEAFGVGVADQFEAAFEELGGTVVKRDGQKYAADVDYTSLFNAANALDPDVVYFGGTQVTGGGLARKQMVQAGMGDIPYTGPDGIADLAPGGSEGGFITLAGVENSDNVYGTVAGVHDLPEDSTFADRFENRYGKPPGAYSALAYACTQVLFQAIEASIGAAGDDLAKLREGVRSYIFDSGSGQTYDTEIGRITFTERGDIEQAYISYYRVNPNEENKKGGWQYIRQEAFEGN